MSSPNETPASGFTTKKDGLETCEEYCTIEASVVTGFEECARGEAREKFDAEVFAFRGRINWQMPLKRVPEVLKMGSIDNFWVVVHTVPHFKFTDQNDSLAALQKMILEVDWESGLRTWRQVFDFPHPIASKPDVIPSPEDLVDVVIVTRQPHPKSKDSKKKNRGKGGKGKKERKGGKANNAGSVTEGPGSNVKEKVDETTTQASGDGGDVEDVCEDVEKLSVVDQPDGDKSDVKTCDEKDKTGICGKIDTKICHKNDETDICGNVDNKMCDEKDKIDIPGDIGTKTCDKNDQMDISSIATAKACQEKDKKDEQKPTKAVPSPKTVVIKKVCPSEMEKTIDIKVITPKNVFPTALESGELRHLEPMEVDSPNASFTDAASCPLQKSGGVSSQTEASSDRPDGDINGKGKDLSSCASSADSMPEVSSPSTSLVKGDMKGGEESLSSEASVGSSQIYTTAFASSIISKLSNPGETESKGSAGNTECSTPPSTPVVDAASPFLVAVGEEKCDRVSQVQPAKPEEHCGSSVDPIVTGVKVSGELSEVNTEALPEMRTESAVQIKESESLNVAAQQTPVNQVISSESLANRKAPYPQDEASSEETSSESKRSVDEIAPAPANSGVLVEADATGRVVADLTDNEPVKGVVASKEAVSKTKPVKERDPTKPSFRVTCNRVGQHPFDSASAAATFGSAVVTYFNWPVDLKNHNIEVLLNIDNDTVSLGIALTRSSLHNRNLVAFGPTTLRATICHNMLRLCRIRNGDFICDPMCGTSAIPVESCINWRNCFTFGGDFHEKAMERTFANLQAVQSKTFSEKGTHLKVDAVQWNIEHFPLRDACVDVFVSDLPFGHRLGCRTVNRTLYPLLLSEMARTARLGARACLLTEDRTSLIKAIQTWGKYWQRRLVLNVNIGGLAGAVFVLIRTAARFERPAKLVSTTTAMPVANGSRNSAIVDKSQAAPTVLSSSAADGQTVPSILKPAEGSLGMGVSESAKVIAGAHTLSEPITVTSVSSTATPLQNAASEIVHNILSSTQGTVTTLQNSQNAMKNISDLTSISGSSDTTVSVSQNTDSAQVSSQNLGSGTTTTMPTGSTEATASSIVTVSQMVQNAISTIVSSVSSASIPATTITTATLIKSDASIPTTATTTEVKADDSSQTSESVSQVAEGQ